MCIRDRFATGSNERAASGAVETDECCIPSSDHGVPDQDAEPFAGSGPRPHGQPPASPVDPRVERPTSWVATRDAAWPGAARGESLDIVSRLDRVRRHRPTRASSPYKTTRGALDTPLIQGLRRRRARVHQGQALRPRSVASSGAASGSCCSPLRSGYPGGSRKTSRRSGWAGHRTMAWTNQTGEARRSDLAT